MMMFFLVALLSWSCGQKKQETPAEESKTPVTLKLKWETEPVLTTCESVLHDEKKDVLYVSNINGKPDEKDGNGFISIVSMDGKVTNEKWVAGVDAPKGMGLLEGKLYVTDIDRVHEIDTETGNITNTYPVEGAVFLNDIAVENGKVYVSDSGGGSIYVIENGNLSTFLSDLQGPNGLFPNNGELVVALWNEKTLNTLDLSSKQITKRVEGVENPDGIEAIGNNEYLVSSWNGMIHHIGSDWTRTVILDTRQDSVSSADIEYVRAKNLLLVPTFFKNTVAAYEVVK
jgi:DNA-binding beta-propeller fold protein YncE